MPTRRGRDTWRQMALGQLGRRRPANAVGARETHGRLIGLIRWLMRINTRHAGPRMRTAVAVRLQYRLRTSRDNLFAFPNDLTRRGAARRRAPRRTARCAGDARRC